MNLQLITVSLLFIFSCNFRSCSNEPAVIAASAPYFKTVKEIPPPPGFNRLPAGENSFTHWLRNISLKKDNHVYLYDGTLKKKQSAHFAILEIPVGKKDLQQCADAVMRLQAEFLFNQKRFDEIMFKDNNGKEYKWLRGDNRAEFEIYLENVFGWCGTASLEKQLNPVAAINEIQPGYVFIRGGFPGHAMIVIDVAVNSDGEKVFMLAQSYMPAQDIHIVKNPQDADLGPWYKVNDEEIIITPEWSFYKKELRKWE